MTTTSHAVCPTRGIGLRTTHRLHSDVEFQGSRTMERLDKFLGWLNGNIAAASDISKSPSFTTRERSRAARRMEVLMECREKYKETAHEHGDRNRT